MSEATPTDLNELLDACAGADRGQRLEALHHLAQRRGPIKDARLAAGLLPLRADDAEAQLRLELIRKLRDPEARAVVLRWVSAQLSAPPPDLKPCRRAMVAAADVVAQAAEASADSALLDMAALPDPAIATAALAALDARAGFEAPRHVPELLSLLAVHFELEAQAYVLTLLGRTRSALAVPAVVESMERWSEANPGQGSRAHAAALQALTGRSLGDRPAAWRAWLQGQPKN